MQTFTCIPTEKNAIKIGVIIFLICSMSFSGFSQCTEMIPPSIVHVKISNDQTINASDSVVYWVCEGVHLTVISSLSTVFYLEMNATINFTNTDGDAVFAKSGCVVTNNSNGHVGVVCNSTNVTINNNGLGTTSVTTFCTNLIYDYSMVGGMPCIGTAGINDFSEIMPISLYPNPVVSSFTLSIENYQFLKQTSFVMYNMLGEEVKRIENIAENKTEISRGNLPSGVYMYRFLGENTILNSGTVIVN